MPPKKCKKKSKDCCKACSAKVVNTININGGVSSKKTRRRKPKPNPLLGNFASVHLKKVGQLGIPTYFQDLPALEEQARLEYHSVFKPPPPGPPRSFRASDLTYIQNPSYPSTPRLNNRLPAPNVRSIRTGTNNITLQGVQSQTSPARPTTQDPNIFYNSFVQPPSAGGIISPVRTNRPSNPSSGGFTSALSRFNSL